MIPEKTVLVVEDSTDIRTAIRFFLLSSGYRVLEAVNGQEAVELVEQRCPDLILMDLNMPHMDGLEAARRIRQCRDMCGRVPIIAITAYDTYGMREAAIEAGCNDYVLKPIDLTELEKVISSSILVEERRIKIRVAGPLPAKVRMRGRGGEVLKAESVAENISTGGFYLRLGQWVEPGTELFAVIQFSKGLRRAGRVAQVAARGVVLRAEPAPGGDYGVAVAIKRHRFL